MKLEDIPFVQEHWKEHPRPPLPKSLIWSEGEAMLIIQSFYRGYKVKTFIFLHETRETILLSGEGDKSREIQVFF